MGKKKEENKVSSNKKDRTGERKIMNCGMECEVVAYRSYKDIDVMFLEDKTLVKNRTCCAFDTGKIYNPNYKPKLNEVKTMGDGSIVTVIKLYEDEDKMDVQFNDGRILKHISFKRFALGSLRKDLNEEKTKARREERLGQRRVMNCGMECEVVEYRAEKDIDVLFLEDNTLLPHRAYFNFEKRDIYNPNYRPKLNERKTMNDGTVVTVIKLYENENKMDVRFDSGRIKKYIGFENFAVGSLRENVHQEKNRCVKKRTIVAN